MCKRHLWHAGGPELISEWRQNLWSALSPSSQALSNCTTWETTSGISNSDNQYDNAVHRCKCDNIRSVSGQTALILNPFMFLSVSAFTAFSMRQQCNSCFNLFAAYFTFSSLHAVMLWLSYVYSLTVFHGDVTQVYMTVSILKMFNIPDERSGKVVRGQSCRMTFYTLLQENIWRVMLLRYILVKYLNTLFS